MVEPLEILQMHLVAIVEENYKIKKELSKNWYLWPLLTVFPTKIDVT
jgi:hypothetical protein